MVVAAGYVATAVVTGLDHAGVLANASGGLLQRIMIITGLAWIVLLAVRLLRHRNERNPVLPYSRVGRVCPM